MMMRTAIRCRPPCCNKAPPLLCPCSARSAKSACSGLRSRPIGSWQRGSHERDRLRSLADEPVAEQLRGDLDHPLTMLEQPLAVAPHEIDLVLAAFPGRGLEVLHRMRSGHFRDEF